MATKRKYTPRGAKPKSQDVIPPKPGTPGTFEIYDNYGSAFEYEGRVDLLLTYPSTQDEVVLGEHFRTLTALHKPQWSVALLQPESFGNYSIPNAAKKFTLPWFFDVRFKPYPQAYQTPFELVSAWGKQAAKVNGQGFPSFYWSHARAPSWRQVHLKVAMEIVNRFTNPGDTVMCLNPIWGSFGVASLLLGRNFVAYEPGREWYEVTEARCRAALEHRLYNKDVNELNGSKQLEVILGGGYTIPSGRAYSPAVPK